MSFLTLPIEVMDGKEQTFEGGKYSCFKDGNAIGAAYGINAPIRAGHAFDNISEFVATLVTSLSVDPNYFPTCLESQSPHLRGQLAGITRAVLTILEYSNPDFISLLKENPNAAKVIDSFVPSVRRIIKGRDAANSYYLAASENVVYTRSNIS